MNNKLNNIIMKESTILKRLKGFGRIRNMTTSGGNDAPNQFVIDFNNGSVFQSYNSIIAVEYKGQIYLGKHWDYSNTTGKYRNNFLDEGVAATRDKVKSGEYKILTY